MDGLKRKTLLKWMIWGYHYFRKHPYNLGCTDKTLQDCFHQQYFRATPQMMSLKASKRYDTEISEIFKKVLRKDS